MFVFHTLKLSHLLSSAQQTDVAQRLTNLIRITIIPKENVLQCSCAYHINHL